MGRLLAGLLQRHARRWCAVRRAAKATGRGSQQQAAEAATEVVAAAEAAAEVVAAAVSAAANIIVSLTLIILFMK